MKQQLKRLIRQKGLAHNIELIKTTNSVADYLSQSKVFITLTHNEGLPNVVLEAAMSQVPAVVSHFEGASEVIIHAKTGYIASNCNDACHYCTLLLNNDSLRQKLGENAKKHIEKNFTLSQQRKFIAAVLRK